MRKARVYSNDKLNPGAEVELRGSAARHVGQVLRRRAGDPLVLFDGEGGEFSSTIREVTKNSVLVCIGPKLNTTVDSTLQLSLWHGLCRGGRMDSVIQKATELGVSCIQPILTERGVVKLDKDKATKRLKHWRHIAISACEQSGRNQLPDIRAPLTLADSLAQLESGVCAILLDPSGQEKLASLVKVDKPIVVLTGPEGGFSDGEIMAATAAGFTPVAMGPRIMRTETAPIVALGLVQYLAGDLAGKKIR